MEKHISLNLLKNYQLSEVFPQTAHDNYWNFKESGSWWGGCLRRSSDLSIRIRSTRYLMFPSIIETNKDDFAKYATQADLLRLHKVFNYVPMAAGEKFKYVRVDPEVQSREISFDLLATRRAGRKC